MLLSEVSSRCTVENESGGNVQTSSLKPNRAQDRNFHAEILPACELGAVDKSLPVYPDPKPLELSFLC